MEKLRDVLGVVDTVMKVYTDSDLVLAGGLVTIEDSEEGYKLKIRGMTVVVWSHHSELYRAYEAILHLTSDMAAICHPEYLGAHTVTDTTWTLYIGRWTPTRVKLLSVPNTNLEPLEQTMGLGDCRRLMNYLLVKRDIWAIHGKHLRT